MLLNSTTNSNGHSIASVSNPDSIEIQLVKPNQRPNSMSIAETISSNVARPIIAQAANTRSRRLFCSSERSKIKIRKSDISCPFRCSRQDLNASVHDDPNVWQITSSVTKKTSSIHRTRSAASQVSLKSIGTGQRDSEVYESKKLHSSLASASSSSMNLSSDSQINLVDASTNCTLKPQNVTRTFNKKYPLDIELDPELEATKQILLGYDVPISRKLIKDLREYIGQYGGIERFQSSLKLESERNKLNLFIASASFGLMSGRGVGVRQKVQNSYAGGTLKTSSPMHQSSKFQTQMPPLASTPPTTPRPRHATPQTPYNPNTNNTSPKTPNATLVSTNSIKSQCIKNSQYTFSHQYSQYTPVSALKQHHVTPSPSNRSAYQFRQNVTSTPSSLDAPPKPPRHTSNKILAN
jgi:hypothetical protein